MIRFLVVYQAPDDPAAFEAHYRDVHVPLTLKLPGLLSYTLSRGHRAVRGQPPYLVAELTWPDWTAFEAAFASPEGRAAAADMANLTAPVASFAYEAEEQLPSVRVEDTDALRGATFVHADLSGARLVECDVRGLRIVGSDVDDVEIGSFAGRLGTVSVDGVPVSDYVTRTLDERFPDRAALREATTVEQFRGVWDEVRRQWDATLDRATRLDEETLNARVGGEWSFLQTLRHLRMASDMWAGRMLLGARPLHPLGLPPEDADGAVEGLEVDARPSPEEVVALFLGGRETVGQALDAVSEDDLDQPRTGVPFAAWGEETRTVRRCLWTILNEHIEHRRYAVRDLDAIAGGGGSVRT